MAAALRRFFAPATLVVFVCTLALPLLPGAHVVWDDDDGGPNLAASLSRTNDVGPARAPAPFEHCALCHWQRALAGATVVQVVSPSPTLTPYEFCTCTVARRSPQTSAIDQPSRAPPSAIVL